MPHVRLTLQDARLPHQDHDSNMRAMEYARRQTMQEMMPATGVLEMTYGSSHKSSLSIACHLGLGSQLLCGVHVSNENSHAICLKTLKTQSAMWPFRKQGRCYRKAKHL
jgi:hypothetical protein